MSVRGRPLALWFLLAVLLQLTVRGFLGGLVLLVDPSGDAVGLSTATLAGTPFVDFRLPGLVLATVLGLVPGVVSYGLVVRRRWAWPGAVAVGVALLVWLGVEVAVGFHRPTVFLNLATALAAVGIALHPAVRADVCG